MIDPETLLIRKQEDEAARKRQPQHWTGWPSSPRAAASAAGRQTRYARSLRPPPLNSAGREKSPLRPPGALSAKRMKVTVVLDANELLAVPAPEGKPRVVLRIGLPDRTVTADIAAKSLGKAQAAIHEAGADNVALVLQGRLAAGDLIAEAGLSPRSRRR